MGVGLAKGGADFLMICCNTMHLMSPAIEKAAGVPLLHIADPLGAAIQAKGIRRVGLVGSCHTMEKGGIVIDRLREKFGIEIVVPDAPERAELHRIIVEELCRGKFLDTARATHREIFAGLVARGAEGIVLGCTEIPILVGPDDATVPHLRHHDIARDGRGGDGAGVRARAHGSANTSPVPSDMCAARPFSTIAQASAVRLSLLAAPIFSQSDDSRNAVPWACR